MSDAFNSYCITCDQLCSQNSVYCSDSCRVNDEHQSATILRTYSDNVVSPLLTPRFFQQQQNSHELNNSPLLLPSNNLEDSDVRGFSLNYAVSLQSGVKGALASTSHNYRLWLTGVL